MLWQVKAVTWWHMVLKVSLNLNYTLLCSCVLPDRQSSVSFPAVHLSLWYWIPAEVQLPVKASIRHVGPRHVLECVIADHVNDGTHNSSPVNTHICFSSHILFLGLTSCFDIYCYTFKHGLFCFDICYGSEIFGCTMTLCIWNITLLKKIIETKF